MFCKQCGVRVADNTKFCKECGARIVAPPSPKQPSVEPQVEQPKPQEPLPKLPKDETPARVYAYKLCRNWVMIAFTVLLCVVAAATVIELVAKLVEGTLVPVDTNGRFQNQDVVNALSLVFQGISLPLLAVGACLAVLGGFSSDSYKCTVGLKCMGYGARFGAIEWIMSVMCCAVTFLAILDDKTRMDPTTLVMLVISAVFSAFVAGVYFSAANAVRAATENMELFALYDRCRGNMLFVVGRRTAISLFVVAVVMCLGLVGVLVSDDTRVITTIVFNDEQTYTALLAGVMIARYILAGVMLIKQNRLATYLFRYWEQEKRQ